MNYIFDIFWHVSSLETNPRNGYLKQFIKIFMYSNIRFFKANPTFGGFVRYGLKTLNMTLKQF